MRRVPSRGASKNGTRCLTRRGSGLSAVPAPAEPPVQQDQHQLQAQPLLLVAWVVPARDASVLRFWDRSRGGGRLREDSRGPTRPSPWKAAAYGGEPKVIAEWRIINS
ncbi:hypothetical protein GCM10027187_64560 [Streptosporangium sandarakinum]